MKQTKIYSLLEGNFLVYSFINLEMNTSMMIQHDTEYTDTIYVWEIT